MQESSTGSHARKSTPESTPEEAAALRDRIVELARGIRGLYLDLGEELNALHASRGYKQLGHVSFKSFVEAEVDVVNGPSASVARRIARFLADDAKETLRDRQEDYARLSEACRKVSTQKLMELAKNADVLDELPIDEIVGNLENLPTKRFKNELKERRHRGKGEDPGGDLDTGRHAGGASAGATTEASLVFETRAVRKTFTLPKEFEPAVETALRKAMENVVPPSPAMALVRICEEYCASHEDALPMEALESQNTVERI